MDTQTPNDGLLPNKLPGEQPSKYNYGWKCDRCRRLRRDCTDGYDGITPCGFCIADGDPHNCLRSGKRSIPRGIPGSSTIPKPIRQSPQRRLAPNPGIPDSRRPYQSPYPAIQQPPQLALALNPDIHGPRGPYQSPYPPIQQPPQPALAPNPELHERAIWDIRTAFEHAQRLHQSNNLGNNPGAFRPEVENPDAMFPPPPQPGETGTFDFVAQSETPRLDFADDDRFDEDDELAE